MTPVRDQFGPQGLDWQDVNLETTEHSYILNVLALGLMVSEKTIFEGSLPI